VAARKRVTLASQTIEPEDEIAEEVGAEEGPDGATVTETAAKAEGAVNVEAAQSNRRRAQIIARKRGGEKHVPWNESNACLLYDDLTQLWPANTIAIMVTRLTGTPASMYLYGKPRNGVELYAAIRNQFHGRREETEYAVAMRDEQTKCDRGRGRVTMPSTLDDTGVPSGAAMPPQFAPPAPQQPWALAQQAGNQPTYAPQPAPPPTDPMSLILQRLSEMQARIDVLSRASAAPQGLGAPPGMQPTTQPGVYYAPGVGYVQAVSQSVPSPAGAPASPVQPALAPAPPLTPADQFRQATALVTGAVTAARDMASLLPAAAPLAAPAEAAAGGDDGPTKIIDLGDLKIVQNTADGSLRPVESILANGDKIMKWVGEQREAYQRGQERIVAMQTGHPVPQAPASSAAPAQQMPAPNLPLPPR
jgi:hypothetical protein